MAARTHDLIGLIPAAGRALRLGRLPCSKELLPIAVGEGAAPGVRVLADHLLASLALAGVERAVMVIDPAKLDLPRHFGAEQAPWPRLAFVVVPGSSSVPQTLDAAHPFVAGSAVALGFPDVLFEPADAFIRLAARREETGAEVVLGLFPATDCRTTDMVELAPEGRVLAVEVRPRQSRLRLAWVLALWGPEFTEFLHGAVARLGSCGGEAQIGDVLRAGLAAGLRIDGVAFPEGRWLDVGTPASLAAALRYGGLPPA